MADPVLKLSQERCPVTDPVLKHARITFILPEGYDKGAATPVSVAVSTAFAGSLRRTIAWQYSFLNNSTWQYTGGKAYYFDLSVKPTSISQLEDLTLQITINPLANHTIMFSFLLELVFDNGEVLSLDKSGNVYSLSQYNRTLTIK